MLDLILIVIAIVVILWCFSAIVMFLALVVHWVSTAFVASVDFLVDSSKWLFKNPSPLKWMEKLWDWLVANPLPRKEYINTIITGKPSNISPSELQEKAERLLSERGWDQFLARVSYEAKGFASPQVDFDIGLSNARRIEKTLQVGCVKEQAQFLCATFECINFEIGTYTSLGSFPDGETYRSEYVELIIADKTVLAVRYSVSTGELFTNYQNYRISSVEEFHDEETIEPLLRGLYERLLQRERHFEKHREELRQNKLRGKFTFKE